ncbi:MAG TPA: hypothetical protein VKQ52_03020 [Puia sp.]|nr:hypothetical protein [Puia sp.]
MYSNKSLIKDRTLQFYCTKVQDRYVRAMAKKAGLAVPEYLRRQALAGFVPKEKTLPPEVLSFCGQLRHLAGLLHPIARKRLDGDDLNALERAELKQTKAQIDDILSHIKKSLS